MNTNLQTQIKVFTFNQKFFLIIFSISPLGLCPTIWSITCPSFMKKNVGTP